MGVVIFSNRTAKRILSLLHDQEGHGIVANPNDRHDSPYRARLVKPLLVCRGESPLKVKVLPGWWHRRDYLILVTKEHEVDVTEGTCYVVIELKSDEGENPSVCPDGAEIKTYRDLPYTGLPSMEHGGKMKDTILVLAKVVVWDNKITAIEQWTAGDVKDWAELPDSENSQMVDRYKTLQWHDIAGQKNTLGLYGIQNVPHPHVAFAVYSAKEDGVGELRWHYPDSDNPDATDESWRDKSIQVLNERYNRVVQLWQFRYGWTSAWDPSDTILIRHNLGSGYELRYTTLWSMAEDIFDKIWPILEARLENPDLGNGAQNTYEELTDYADGTTIRSTSGQLVIGQRRWNIGELSLSGSGVIEGAVRWAYVEINLDTGDAELKISADGNKPTDTQTSSGYLYCITLSRWKRTADGWERLCRARPELHIHGILAE